MRTPTMRHQQEQRIRRRVRSCGATRRSRKGLGVIADRSPHSRHNPRWAWTCETGTASRWVPFRQSRMRRVKSRQAPPGKARSHNSASPTLPMHRRRMQCPEARCYACSPYRRSVVQQTCRREWGVARGAWR
eukprot:scaffold14091_cov121-Isochrysis_galbana.AAC.16